MGKYLIVAVLLGLSVGNYSGSVLAQGKNPSGQVSQDLERRAAQGEALAQLALGLMYHLGDGVRQDYGQARQWFEKAAAQGLADAQFALGGLYKDGLGVRQDVSKAKQYFGNACDNGLQSGCNDYRELNEAGY